MKKNKVVIIILATFFSFVFGGGCYYFFCLSGKNKKVSASKDDVFDVAYNYLMASLQKLADYEQKIFTEKNINRENIVKNIDILQNRGVWENSNLEADYKKYLDDHQKELFAFKLQIDELLEKVKKKEKSLESFREELEKIGEEIKKNIDENAETFDEIAERIQKEAEKPMPFLATWIGIVVSVIICPIISYFILLSLQKYKWCEKKEEEGGGHIIDFIFTMLICLPLQSLIFPLLNCLLSLKMSCFREIYKHHFSNEFKLLFISLSFFFLNLFIGSGCCCKGGEKNNKDNNKDNNNIGGTGNVI